MSSRNHDDNTASAPLLGDQQEDEPRDVRFAISEEDAEDPNDVEEGGAKYPPPSSLPPSYNEATHRRDPWYKSEVALSLHHYGRICLGGSASFIRRYWPTSRFAQAGFFIVGLWILVIVSGPTWDGTGRLGMGKGGDDLLASLPPPPLMGDGHYLQSAIWSPPTCRPTPTGMATYCTRTSTYNLTYPRAESSFRSSDKVFIFVDPLRGHGFSDERGRVPSSVEVRVDESAPREEALVTVEAQYEQELQALLERANVGLMAAGVRDRGVGIYTWPLPFHLRIVPVHLYPYPLLSFKITVRIHPQSQIPNFIIDGAKMDVGLFRELPNQQGGGKGKGKEIAQRSEEGLQMFDIGRLKTVRLGHAIGKHRAEEAERVRKRNDDEGQWPFFGIVRLVTGEGNLLFGGHTRVMGRIWAATKGGSIDVGQDARLRGIELHLEASAVHHNSRPDLVRDRDGGDLTIAKGAQLDAKDIVALYANGNKGVQIGDDAWISATRLSAEVKGAGGIGSADSSDWRTNHSLALTVSNGGIVAPVSVSPPTRRELGTGTEQRPWVGVDAVAGKGDVSLRFKHHEAGLPVRVSAKTQEKGNVEVAMREEYAGSFHVKAPNRGDLSVVAPKAVSNDAAKGTRVFSSKDEQGGDASKAFDTTGEVWWRKKEGDQHAQGEDWGQVQLEAAAGDAGATAKLSFDA